MLDSRLKNCKPQLTIVYEKASDNQESWLITINPTLKPPDIFRNLTLYIETKNNPLTGELAKRFIESRTFQKEYEFIKYVLLECKLPYYDMWGIFKAYNGKSQRDSLYLMPWDGVTQLW